MSRLDKKFRHFNEEIGLRVFAFSTHAGGYKPLHAAPAPVIVLRTKAKKEDEHPALQWRPLADALLERDSCIHSSFVVDASRMGPNCESEELTYRNGEGPILKKLSHVLSRLAPSKAVFVGAGCSGELLVKMSILSHAAAVGHVGSIVLIRPTYDNVKALVETSARHLNKGINNNARDNIPMIRVCILTSETGAESDWAGAFACLPQFEVHVSILTSNTTLFNEVAELAIPEKTEVEPSPGSRLEFPECYKVDFALNRYTKQPEQVINKCPINTNPNIIGDDDVVVNSNSPSLGEKRQVDPSPSPSSNTGATMQSPLQPSQQDLVLQCDLYSMKNARVKFSGNILSKSTVGTVHGKVSFSKAVEAFRDIATYTPVSFTVSVLRNEEGRTFFDGNTIKDLVIGGPVGFLAVDPSTKAVTGVTCSDVTTVGDTRGGKSIIPHFNLSSIRQYYGVALIRGRKIVLVRNMDGMWKGMRIPRSPHQDASETPMELAASALVAQCEVSLDTFFIHPVLAPVTVYNPDVIDGSTGMTALTIFIAFATQEAEGGAETDNFDLQEQLHDRYDWYTMSAALLKLGSKAERDAIHDVYVSVRRAYDAGVYVPMPGYGVFGEPPKKSLAVGDVKEEHDPTSIYKHSFHNEESTTKIDCPLVLIHSPIKELPQEHVIEALYATNKRVTVYQGSNSLVNQIMSLYGDSTAPAYLFVGPDQQDTLEDIAQHILPPILPSGGNVQVVIVISNQVLEQYLLEGPSDKLSAVVQAVSYADYVTGSIRDECPSSLVSTVLHMFNGDTVFCDWSSVVAFGGCAAPPQLVICPNVFSVQFNIGLPFKPEALHRVIASFNENPEQVCGKAVVPLFSSGFGWLSTSNLHHVIIDFQRPGKCDTNSVEMVIKKGAPWWCCVEDGCRPYDIDTSSWHPIHGSRTQQFVFTFLGDIEVQDAAKKCFRDALISALCTPEEYKFWHRLPNPLTIE